MRGRLDDRGRVELAYILEAPTTAERRQRVRGLKEEHDLADPRQRGFVNAVLANVPGTWLFVRNAVVGFVVIATPLVALVWLAISLLR